jgi:hypothetical protein
MRFSIQLQHFVQTTMIHTYINSRRNTNFLFEIARKFKINVTGGKLCMCVS